MLETSKLPVSVMIDCSHGNSAKDHNRQPVVLEDVLGQITGGNDSIHAVMLESNLEAGNQPFPVPLEELKYGISITDACIDWKTTEQTLRHAHETLATRFQ